MLTISAFSITSKSTFSLSGVCIQVATTQRNELYKLFRQFDDREKELLCEFHCDYNANKLITFKINTRIRNVYGLVEKVKSSARDILPENEGILVNTQEITSNKPEVLKLWHKYFNSDEFILNNYYGYIFVDKQRKLWIYDLVPAIKEFSQLDTDSLLPVPGSHVTYSIVSSAGNEEIFTKSFIIPSFLASEVQIYDIFEYSNYLYHIALFNRDKCLWGNFSTRPSKRTTKFFPEPTVENKDFICSIKPDITTLPNIKPDSCLFAFTENPPHLSTVELMNTSLRITKIKTDTGKSNNFNSLTFESKFFKSSNFPKTIMRIFPYR